MPRLQAVRWPNGDMSIVLFSSEDELIDLLDQVADPSSLETLELPLSFAVHLRLSDDGALTLEDPPGLDENTLERLEEWAWPIVTKAYHDAVSAGKEPTRQALRDAVALERARRAPVEDDDEEAATE